MFTMDQYKRTPLYKKDMLPGHYFYYARIPKGANYMSIGVGTESTEGLQVAHQEIDQIHRQLVEGRITDIRGPISRGLMREGPLVQRIFGDEEAYRKERSVGLHLDERERSGLILQSSDLADVMLNLSIEAWGLDGQIKTIPLANGRGDALGFYYDYDNGTIVIGSYSPAYGLREATRLHRRNGRKVAAGFYCRAADLRLFSTQGHGHRASSIQVTDAEYQALAIAIVRLADKRWTPDTYTAAEPIDV